MLGKLFFDLKELQPDFLAFNGDHLHAPKGTGGLYIAEGIKCSPFIVGGIEQGGLRAGSVNVPALVGLGVAAKEALETRDFLCTEVARLKYHFEKELIRRIPEAVLLFENAERLPHVSAVAFPGIPSETFLFALNRRGVLASMGGGTQQQISYILHASGVPDALAKTAISFSLSRETTEEEIERSLNLIEAVYLRLRKVSEKMVPKG